jgi:hypothetical protein
LKIACKALPVNAFRGAPAGWNQKNIARLSLSFPEKTLKTKKKRQYKVLSLFYIPHGATAFFCF